MIYLKTNVVIWKDALEDHFGFILFIIDCKLAFRFIILIHSHFSWSNQYQVNKINWKFSHVFFQMEYSVLLLKYASVKWLMNTNCSVNSLLKGASSWICFCENWTRSKNALYKYIAVCFWFAVTVFQLLPFICLLNVSFVNNLMYACKSFDLCLTLCSVCVYMHISFFVNLTSLIFKHIFWSFQTSNFLNFYSICTTSSRSSSQWIHSCDVFV